MFGHRYFGARFFGPRYFGPRAAGAAAGPDQPNDARTLANGLGRARRLAAPFDRVRSIGRKAMRLRNLRSS